MRPSDVVNQLRTYLPKFTGAFTDTRAATVVVAGGVATATNLSATRDSKVGEMVVIWDSTKQNDIVSVTQDGLIFTFETTSNHQLTLGFNEDATLDGFTEPEWNGTFSLTAVPSPTTFKVQSTNSAVPSPIDGALVEVGDINGSHGVTAVAVPDTVVFPVPGVPDQTLSATLEFAPRVMALPSPELIEETYTEQGADDFWMFVVPGDALASKSRHVLSDAVVATTPGDDIRTRMVEPYSIYVVLNTDAQFKAEHAMDLCRHDLITPITRSVMGVKFSQGVCNDKLFKFMLTGHALAAYRGQTYVHVYTFENAFDVTAGDQHIPASNAFRDLTLNFNYTGGNTLTAHTELPAT